MSHDVIDGGQFDKVWTKLAESGFHFDYHAACSTGAKIREAHLEAMGHRAIVPQATIAAHHALLLMEIFAFTLAFCLGWLICAAMIDLLDT